MPLSALAFPIPVVPQFSEVCLVTGTGQLLDAALPKMTATIELPKTFLLGNYGRPL
jgi:hypothetical protein